ncbi:MAG: HetP family heterocyst commitment protein [Cyanobacteria bacterium CRU_2_1]|nr:HetP family heterocyst commitment protein [Cyanobacteria bacterium CRU_2_1]
MNSNSNPKLDRAMTTEQFTQVVDAILAGKYSWACVLILRFAGYNPLHYIPYRTYNRLMKENGVTIANRKRQKDKAMNHSSSESFLSRNNSDRISDLNYMESLNETPSGVRGGDRLLCFAEYEKDLV